MGYGQQEQHHRVFRRIGRQYSIEAGSQAMHGEVPPIKRYGGQPKLEEEAFKLRPGELSGVIQVADKFIILRCEGYTKPANVDFASVRKDIYEDLHEKKLRLAMAERFENLQEAATVDNYLAGTSHSPKPQPTDRRRPPCCPAPAGAGRVREREREGEGRVAATPLIV